MTIDERFGKTVFLVEATSTEQIFLWQELQELHASACTHRREP